MKQILLTILALNSIQFAISQTWQPLYSEETFNYTSTISPEETIGIYGEDNSFNPDLKLTLYADEDCSAMDCENCFQLTATFLQSEMHFSPDGVISFQNPDTFFIHTLANVGDSWVFGMDEDENDITATVTDLSEIDILGQTDSLKTIMLSDGREIHLSKAHGIYQWITPDDTFTLTSIPQRELGPTYLTKNEVYDFNVGDVFCYRSESYAYESPQFSNPEYSNTTTSISRYEVINTLDNENLKTIEFSLTTYYDTYSYYIPGDITAGQGTYQDTVTAIINLNDGDLIFTFPNQGYFYRGSIPTESEAYWLAGNSELYTSEDLLWPYGSIKLEHAALNDRKTTAFGIKDFHFAFNAETPAEEILDASPFDQFDLAYGVHCNGDNSTSFGTGNSLTNIGQYEFEEDSNPPMMNDVSAYAEGLGNLAFLARYFGIGFFGHSNSILIGYQKGEETSGYVPSELDLIILNASDASTAKSFTVYPNPANDAFQISYDEMGPSDIRVFDISGREIYSDTMNGDNLKIQTGNYPSGIYFIRLDTPSGVAVQKVIVLH